MTQRIARRSDSGGARWRACWRSSASWPGSSVGVVPTAAAGEPGANPFVQIHIDQVSPQVATTTSEPVVSVAGTVTNIGDRPVHDLMLRLERAPAVPTSMGLRTNLDGDTDQYQAAMDFATVSPELQRGQKTKFTLSAPMRSAGKHSLEITAPGVYPLLVNVNGTPDYGEPARLDNARFLLPVLGVPPDPLDTSGDALAAVVAPDTSKPVPITMLWPLADRPRLAPGVPGGTIPVRLMDDELAASLASGGRLDVLLAAAEFATSHDVDPDGAVGRSMCLAVDPDLLVTVNAMTAGYVVSDSPAGPAQEPGTPTHPGTGQAAAVELAEPPARSGAPDVCRAAALRPSRPRRRPADRRSRPERDRDQRGRRRRRPDPGCRRGPRRHPDPGRLADRAAASTCSAPTATPS